ncbi:putative polysaccharide biosynthesis protein [Clostridium polynesiense]|uniref:putative polysaccharide biosynthesis protein n=1 Tax=Clostridium polynesiense TaxID=1325933 RepID=UPI00058D3743|nr:polysaccharide biosynthesis protein [Clostridium polynesiense]
MKEQSTTRGMAILSAAGIAVKLLSLLYVPVLISIIGTNGFGVYNNTYAIFTWVYAMTNIGMQPAIAKLVAELDEAGNPKDALRAFKLSRALLFIVGITATLLLIVFAKPLSDITKNPRAMYSLMTLAPTVAVTSVLVAYRGYFQGRNIITPIGVSQVIEQFANVFVSLLFAYMLMNISLEAGVAGGTVGTSVGALISILYLIYIYNSRKYFKIPKEAQTAHRRHSTKYLVKKVIKYGMPITLSAGLQNFGTVIDATNVRTRLLAGGFSIDSVDQLTGYLGQYQNLAYVPLVFITAIATIVLPAISRAVVNRDKEKVKEKINFAFKVGYIITIPSAVGLVILSSSIYKLLYWKDPFGYKLMMYGAFIMVFMAVVQLQTTILQSLNKFYTVLYTLLAGLIVKIILNYILIAHPEINIYGAIIGGYVGYLITFVLNIRVLRKAIKKRTGYFSLMLAPAAASAIMGVFVHFINKYMLLLLGGSNPSRIHYALVTLIAVLAGVIIYAYGLILTGVLTKGEIESISPRIYNKIPRFIKNRMR